MSELLRIPVPDVFTGADEGYLLAVLQEMLHPTAGGYYLSQEFTSLLEQRNGYLLLLMVRKFFLFSFHRKLPIIQISLQVSVN